MKIGASGINIDWMVNYESAKLHALPITDTRLTRLYSH